MKEASWVLAKANDVKYNTSNLWAGLRTRVHLGRGSSPPLVLGGFIGGLTYLSRSVRPAAFLHAAHNNYDQAVFGVITRGDDMMYYVSETGLLTIICAWVIAIIMIVKLRDAASNERGTPDE